MTKNQRWNYRVLAIIETVLTAAFMTWLSVTYIF